MNLRETAVLVILRAFFGGNVGLVLEGWFTGLHSAMFKKDPELRLTNTLWAVPIYGFGIQVLWGLHSWHPPLFLFLWAGLAFIWTWEWATGTLLLKFTGRRIWDYRHSRWSAGNGFVRWDYAPFWLGMLLGYDKLGEAFETMLTKMFELM